MKRLLTAMLLMCATTLSAQQYKQDYVISKGAPASATRTAMVYGVMGGVTLPRMTDKSEVIDITHTAGYSVGLMWGLDLGSVEFVPEIWYRHSNSDLEASGDDYSLKNNTLEVPLLCALKMGCLRLNFGPSFSLLSNGTLERGNKSYEFGRVRSTVGYVVGLSAVLVEHVVLDVRYNGHFVPLDVAWYSGDDLYTYSYRSVGFNVGYRF